MTEEKQEQMEAWFDKYDWNYEPKLTFENCDHVFNKSEQVSAIVFLASKLKDKSERFFIEGQHDVIYIGSSFDIFEDFTEDDVKIAVAHGIRFSDVDGGFMMYASM